jgi:hypothetical protein
MARALSSIASFATEIARPSDREAVSVETPRFVLELHVTPTRAPSSARGAKARSPQRVAPPGVEFGVARSSGNTPT